MKRVCQHCGELIIGDAYRITSEEDGIILLNMVVCSLCSIEAKRLRLHTEEWLLEAKTPRLEAEEVIVCDSEFDSSLPLFCIQRILGQQG